MKIFFFSHNSNAKSGERSINDINIPINQMSGNIDIFLSSNIRYRHINRLNNDMTLTTTKISMPGIISYKFITN